MTKAIARKIGGAFLGYIIVVPIAVFATALFMLAPTVFPDNGRWGSVINEIETFGGFLFLGTIMTGLHAWPGYGVTQALVLTNKIRPTRFALSLAGTLTAVLAIFLSGPSGLLGDPLAIIITKLGICSVLGGAVAGYIYSYMHTRLTGHQAVSSSPAPSES